MTDRNKPYTRGQGLADLLAQRIVLFDGAMGTMIQRFKLSEAQYRGTRFKDFHRDIKGNNELLSLTRPDIIEDVHEGYLAAGADMIGFVLVPWSPRAVDLEAAHLLRRAAVSKPNASHRAI